MSAENKRASMSVAVVMATLSISAMSPNTASRAQNLQVNLGTSQSGGWDYGDPGTPPRFEIAIFDQEGPHNPIPEVSSLVPATRSSYRAYYDTTMSDPTLTPAERRIRIANYFQSLRTGIVAQRTASHLRFSYRLHARHSCTDRGSGTTRCPSATKCRTIEGVGLVTRREWMGLIRTNVLDWDDFDPPNGVVNYQRGLIRSIDPIHLGLTTDGRTFCPPNLRKSSNGFIRDLAYAHFGYSDDYIRTASERDADTVMSAAVQ
jgi:hypothetical protein